MPNLFDPQLVNTTGCDLPTLPITEKQNELLQRVISGEIFENPLEGVATATQNAMNDAVGRLGGFSNTGDIRESLANAADQIGLMRDHTRRLSGLSENPGNALGLQGIQAIANTFNNFKNSIEGGTIGQDLVDNYTPFFQSVLGPGSTVFESLDGLLTGDFENALKNMEAAETDADKQAAIQKVRQITESVNDIVAQVESIRLNDENQLAGALDYVAKVGLGFSVLGMAEDPCFSQKVLQNIVKPDVKGLLNL
tara:strand:+ start:4449 stop:5207 length:759 start_codon:yes stop_codon:yes gene_type:complete